jgi:peptidoglycan/xylan/chitin deacetylase (PgdA/CDA1 family)
MDLTLTGGTLAALEKDGIHAATSFVAPKSAYRVREIVREAGENRIAVSNTSYEVK